MTREQAITELVSVSIQLFLIGIAAGAVTRQVFPAPLSRTLARMILGGLFGLVLVWLFVLRLPVDITMVIAVGTMLSSLVAGNLIGWLAWGWVLDRRDRT
jgi:hypothetical protein